MPGLWFYSDPIDKLHQENYQFLKTQRFKKYSPQRETELRAERRIIELATSRGYRVTKTSHKSPFDLWIEGVRVESKAATWHAAQGGGGRYQAAVRNHLADILIFDCLNGDHHFHIIPMSVIIPRRHLAVWSYDPALSSGQWLPFLERWDYLDQAVDQAVIAWQPPLF